MNTKKIFALLLALVFLTGVLSGCNGVTDDTGYIDNNDMYIGDDKGDDDNNDNGGLLQGKLGASGKQVTEYDGFLGFGYNVIESPYYRSEDVKQCVLDIDKMAADGLVYEDLNNQTATSFSVDSGEDLHSYMRSMATSAGMSTDSLFGGSLKVDFGLDTSSKVDESKSFAKGSATLTRSKQYVMMSKVTYGTLRSKYVYETFRDNYLLNEKYSPADLFREFGTHIMLTVYLGGRLDMCYVYNNTQKESAMDITSKVEASFSFVEGQTSTDIKEKANSLVKNSTFKLKTYGGRVDVNMTTLENAKEHYEDWAKSIQDAQYQVLIKAGRLDSTAEMFPIWMLIDPESSEANRRRYNAILEEFNKQLEQAAKNLDNIQTVKKEVYIKNIYIGSKEGKNGDLAISDLLSKTTEELTIIRKDLNYGAGGDYIYLGYTTTTNPNEAIRDLVLVYGKDPADPIIYKDTTFNKINNDLNRGARGDYIYLYFSKNPKLGDPIKALFVEINGDSSGKNGTGWSRVTDYKDSSKCDLNRNAGGAYIYLWMQR